ncbi:uncharacterized protein EI90DRAFT_3027901, partial [Cantharellus anzutake]|uniref:uncharacterized protein n=1 Tax=Cantharellus anzutake TaxID=1750568 RepID=UPI00190877A2
MSMVRIFHLSLFRLYQVWHWLIGAVGLVDTSESPVTQPVRGDVRLASSNSDAQTCPTSRKRRTFFAVGPATAVVNMESSGNTGCPKNL